MRSLKYGLVITVGIALWVLADRFWMHTSQPGSKARFLTPVVFNLVQFVVLFAGIRAVRLAKGALTLRQGFAGGMRISLTYAVSACLFFLGLYLIVGSRLMENESAAFGNDRPERYVLLGAFAGVFFSAMIGGALYSAVISFILRTDLETARRA